MIIQNQYDNFWKWFKKYSEKLFYYEKNGDVLDELGDELRKINENLTFEFGPSDNNKRDFTISADGIQEAFPFVEKLFNAKPLLDKWNVQKFRRRGDLSLVITINNFTLYPNDIKYLLFPDKNKIGLLLFIKGFDDNKDKFIDLAYIFLDNALGEYDVETKVGVINFCDWTCSKTEVSEYFEQSKSIESFRTDFDNMYKKMNSFNTPGGC
ncbi:MAG: hypothetical protein LBC53_06350 [Spirochaetaceae bacterium]|jgi:hypothetical protein|nr:hypothetical protein [Spirochaetaceae bacterium]